MSLAVVDRRRANAFAEAVDESGTRPDRPENPGPGTGPGPGPGTGPQAELPRLLGTVDLLKERFAAPQASPDFRAALRQRLLDEAAALSATAELPAVPAPRGGHRRHAAAAPPRVRPWRRRLAVAGALVVVTGSGLGGVAYASTDALPGDLTYGVKRTMESWDRSLAGSDRERGEVYLRQARTRMDEAERLLRRSGGGGDVDRETVGHLRQVLADAHDQARHGRDLLTKTYERDHRVGPIQDLAAFAATGTQRMDRITTRLPAEVRPERDQVVSLLTAISQQVAPIPGALDEAVPAAGDGPASIPGRPPSGGPGAPAGPSGAPGGGAQPGPGTSATPAPVVPGLNLPLLGPTANPSAPASAAPSGSASPDQGSTGLTIPPLLPGLPGIGISLGGE